MTDYFDTTWKLFGGRRIFQFAQRTQSATEEEIAQFMAKMANEKPLEPASLFIRAAFDEAAPRASWKFAVNALKTIEAQGSWGSKVKRTRLTAVAREPRVLAGAQAAAVGAARVPAEYLAVLAIDGSDASIDALIPHFDAARKDPTRLDELSQLSIFAKDTPALKQLIARAKEQLDVRSNTGPSLQLARELGIAGQGRFRVHVRGAGAPDDETSFDLLLDSESPDDFRIYVYLKGRRTTFSAGHLREDDLNAGRCELPALPKWLADRQTSLATRWNQETIWTAYLKGKRLQIFLDWLLGPSRVG